MKKLLSLFLVICMILSLTSVAMAVETPPLADMELDVFRLDDVELTPLPIRQAAPATYAMTNTTSNYLYYSLQDYITSDGEMLAYGAFEVYPNEIFQVGLQSPANSNVDYDLYIAEVDANGNITNVLASSTYATYIGNGMTRSVDEGIDYLHTGSDILSVAILVSSNYGYDVNAPFTLYLAFDSLENCLGDEGDQNAVYAGATLNVGGSLTGYNLNSPADVDWYYLNIELDEANAAEEISLSLKDPATGAAIASDLLELYLHIGNNQLARINPTDGIYRFPIGTNGLYYLRVAPSNRDSFVRHPYTLTATLEAEEPIAPDPTPTPTPTPEPTLPTGTRARITGYSASTDPSGIQYVLWPQFTQAAYIVDVGGYGWFQVHGELRDGNGNLVTNSNASVIVAFENRYWREHNPAMGRVTTSADVNADGTFVARFTNIPPAAGMMHTYYNSASNMEHHYDLADVIITVCDTFGNEYASIPDTEATVYHRSYSMQP